MIKAPIPLNEQERIQELIRLEILDTDCNIQFDEITKLAQSICGTSISLISLVDTDRQWFKSKQGLSVAQTSRDISWCAHAILQDDVFEIPDSGLDDRFKNNPLYLEDPRLVFYAGAPLKTKNGFNIGTLCVIDTKPQKLSFEQKENLKRLSRVVVGYVEAHLSEKKYQEISQKHEIIVNSIPIMLSIYDDHGSFEWVNKQWTTELGWDVESMKEVNVIDELYPDPRYREKAIQFMGNPGSRWEEFYTRKKDGSYIHTSWSNVKLKNGKSIGIGKNIDSRKKLEIQRDKNFQRTEYILESAQVGSWDWWLDDNRVLFDRRWCEMLGLDPDLTEMKLSTWEQRVHPDDKEKCHQDIKDYLDGKTKIYENIHRIKHTNGSWVWILDRGKISEYDELGKPLRFTGIHLDLTKQKKLEEFANEVQDIANIGGWELDINTFETHGRTKFIRFMVLMIEILKTWIWPLLLWWSQIVKKLKNMWLTQLKRQNPTSMILNYMM